MKKYDGPVYVPAEVYKLLSPEAGVALKKYNSEAINKMAKKRCIYVTDVTDHELSIAETTISEEQTDRHQDDDVPESEIDPILDYINRQHQEEDMNHALRAYNIMSSPFQMLHPSGPSTRSILICFIMLPKQNKHNMVHLLIGELMVDLQALMQESSPMYCHWDRPTPDQWARYCAMCCIGKINHGYINLIMNEYAYYGKGHTIHSSGQIEWNKNQVDDRSVKVGGSQCITTLDGYSFPLKCTG